MTIGTRQVRMGLALVGALGMGALAAAADKAPAGAYAVLNPTQGSAVKGRVEFKPARNGVLVTARIEGLTPGTHGFHVHEKGDCSAADATSAGGHFNPAGKPHGHHSSAERHAGDMPSLVADGSGNAELSVTLDLLAVGSGAADVIGKSVVVHKDPDDYTSQPAGNSGARVACGVVRAS
jgi:superoxide dismutase, Cu-Zn family